MQRSERRANGPPLHRHQDKENVAAVDEESRSRTRGWGCRVVGLILESLKTYRTEGLMNVKCVEVENTQVIVESGAETLSTETSRAILCLGPNSIGSSRQKAVVTEIIYLAVPRKPYGGSINRNVTLTLGIPSWVWLPHNRPTLTAYSFHSSTSRSTCAKERKNGWQHNRSVPSINRCDGKTIWVTEKKEEVKKEDTFRGRAEPIKGGLSSLKKDVAAVAEWYRYRIVACLVTSSIPVPLKTRRVGQRCTLNLSRAETSSRWCGS
ncbi:histone-lysine N-methyltransferase SETMAR [Trichonephila clavipes]|nr:histone-lysine N-methyltransferase SETMAR [Trichonephila clavipes]